MKILFEHAHPLPVKKYGGTERILFWLMKELVRLGHQVVLIGHPDSRVREEGIELIVPNQKDFRSQIPKDIDLAHLFYAPPWELPCPLLVTIEGNGKVGEVFPQNTVFVSRNHAQRHGSDQFVYNGLDLSDYPFLPRSRPRKNLGWERFLFLAKASWKVKNLDACVKACKKSRKHLHVAGGRAWSFSRYIHSHGMVGQDLKLQLLQKSDALLFPVRWPEPFGIAMIEAYSQGLPVIGSCYGSLPEIIQPHTGVMVNDFSSLQRVVENPPRPFDPEEIRHFVEQQFSIQKMTRDYLQFYEKISRGETLNRERPQNRGQEDPEKLLPFG